MTAAHRNQLREIMQMAWSWFRQVGGEFADALRLAWRKSQQAVAPAVRIVQLKSPIYSPTSSRLASARYGRTRDWQAGLQIARVVW